MLQEPRRVPPSADGGRGSNRVFRRRVRRKTHFPGRKCASESESAQRPASPRKNACIFEKRVEVFRHAGRTPVWYPHGSSLSGAYAMRNCRLYHITIQERHDLTAGAGHIRAERGRGGSCRHILCNRPLDSRRIVGICRYIGKRVTAGNSRGAICTMQESHGLAAGYGHIWAERCGAGTARNTVFNRPKDGVIVIRIRVYIRERVCAGQIGRASCRERV